MQYVEVQNAFCQLLGTFGTTTIYWFRLHSRRIARNSGTTTIYRFRMVSRRVRNLQLHNRLAAALSQKVCVTVNKYYSYICDVTLWHMNV